MQLLRFTLQYQFVGAGRQRKVECPRPNGQQRPKSQGPREDGRVGASGISQWPASMFANPALRCVPREREHGGHAHRLHEEMVFGEPLPHESAPVREIRGSNGFAFSFLVARGRFLRMRLEVALRRFACEVQQAYQAARSKHRPDGESDAQQSRPPYLGTTTGSGYDPAGRFADESKYASGRRQASWNERSSF